MSHALILVAVLAANAQWLGPKVAAPDQLTRVVTAAPSITESIIALGATPVLVGVSRFDEFAEVKSLTRIGGFNDVSVEAVVALKPQLIIVQKGPGNQKPIETLASLGIPVLALSLSTMADVNEMLEVLGTTLGKTEKAKGLISEIDQTRQLVRSHAAERKTRPTVLLAYGFSPLVVAGPGSFANELLQDLGLQNLASAARSPYPVFSQEKLVASRPALMIDAADVPDGKKPLQELKALKTTRWISLPSKDLLHPGPALAHGLIELDQLINTP